MAIPTKEEMYAALCVRHGAQMQAKFAAGAVAVCGLGGLGSNVAIHLARAGIGRLHLIDFDCVDISNLNRQQYFPEQLGQYKTAALTETLHRIAPYCELTSETVKLTEENIPELLAEFPVICEAFDRADQKAMLVNCVLEHLPQAYLVSASGMAGMDTANTIRTQRITSHFYLCGDGKSDAADGLGLISARVAVCAAHQAQIILRILANLVS
ncbi:MAG: sulfur carrier protein ThiS adenylyltransferase ThiF [Oscillospiraceae bacterium]|nr:sulfur carrier protein ThiS adenylyltransferase ThiF [Oscillospiraceae bacterium]